MITEIVELIRRVLAGKCDARITAIPGSETLLMQADGWSIEFRDDEYVDEGDDEELERGYVHRVVAPDGRTLTLSQMLDQYGSEPFDALSTEERAALDILVIRGLAAEGSVRM